MNTFGETVFVFPPPVTCRQQMCVELAENPLDAPISHFINVERNRGANYVVSYLFGSFAGSLGTPNNPLWDPKGNCDTYLTGTYADARTQSNPGNGFQPAVSWLHNYLQCQLYNTSTDPSAASRRTIMTYAYVNIMREINAAVSNLNLDATGGVTIMVQVNSGPNTASGFVTNINGCSTTPTQGDVQTAYEQHIATIRPYNPGTSYAAILRPSLRAELQSVPSGYQLSCYTWVTFSFILVDSGFVR